MKHHSIPASHFSKKTLRSLTAMGIIIVSMTFIPDSKGDFCNGETAYLLSNGQLKTFLQVLEIAK